MTASCGSPMDWSNCYSGQYDLWTPESYAHPAKMSPALAFRILEHLAELGLLRPGQVVLDPMCGTGTTLLAAAVKGHPAVGVELEPRFVDCVTGFLCPGIAHYTVEEEHLAAEEAGWRVKAVHRTDDEAGVEERRYWQRALPERIKYRVHVTSRCGKPGWHAAHRVIGNAPRLASKGFGAPIRVIQGDARNLSTLLQERGLCAVSSPPYGQSVQGDTNQAEKDIKRRHDRLDRENITWQGRRAHKTPGEIAFLGGYGTTPGQIGALPDRPVALTSPPYIDADNRGKMDKVSAGWGRHDGRYRGPILRDDYGSTPGQIGSLPDRPCAITSPPYEDSEIASQLPTGANPVERKRKRADGTWKDYGDTSGQLGQERGATYLSAMRQVYAEIAKVADVLAIVLKNPTRNGKLRRLDLDTIAILEATGWQIHCHHHALLFTEQEQGDMFAGPQKRVKGRMSFFKRLSWAKGSPVAKWEDVIVAVRRG